MTMGVLATRQSMYGRVYTCFVQLGLSQNLGQEKQGGVCYPAMCIPLCGISLSEVILTKNSRHKFISLSH